MGPATNHIGLTGKLRQARVPFPCAILTYINSPKETLSAKRRAVIDQVGQLWDKAITTGQVILKNTTESPKKIQVPDHCSEEDLKVTDLSQLPYINNFQKVAVDVKVFDATEPMIVTGGKKSKKLPLVTKLVRLGWLCGSNTSDCSKTARPTTWKTSSSGSMVQSSTYPCPKRVGRSLLLTTLARWSNLKRTSLSTRRRIFNAVIVAVPYLDFYKACIRCKACVEP